MIKRSPQEIADFFQCYVAQDANGEWYINGCKPELKIEDAYWNPQRSSDDFVMNIFSILVDAPADHHWTHLYEPSAKESKISSNYQDSPKVDNKPGHLGEVYVHKEYKLVTGSTVEFMDVLISEYMAEEGWKPQGGIFFDDGVFYQAMVRGV